MTRDREDGGVPARLAALRERMRASGMDAYLVPSGDFHGSENMGEYFQCRAYITGFTGSAGTAAILPESAGLWTDGRYFVQAEAQLLGSGISLFKMGQEGVPDLEDYLAEQLPEGGVLGLDGRMADMLTVERLVEKLAPKRISLSFHADLAGDIWTDRPPLSHKPLWIVPERLAGEAAGEKLAALKAEIREKNATAHVLTALDEIAWLLNLRGGDIDCTPLFLAYFLITGERMRLFVQEESLSGPVRAYLDRLGVETAAYAGFYEALSELSGETVLLEKARVNARIGEILCGRNTILDSVNPAARRKAVKNPVEMEHMRKAHIRDGVAVTRFLYWLKHAVGAQEIDECAAAARLSDFRAEQEGSLGPSFETISAYGPNAAMCHYRAQEGSGRRLEPKGLYLVDSGGHYEEGTTDITRTVALGPLTEEEKKCFTLVAAGMLRLLNVKFLSGCRGVNLDFAARELLWRNGLDYNHGTGHGVAFLGPVHERPNGIRWRMTPGRPDTAVFEEGMITSNEPGLYLEGRFGVRTENMMLCVKAEKNEYGQFLRFENLTWAPIDLDAIDARWLEERDRRLLNEYHQKVFEHISPWLPEEEAAWLKEVTREI